MKDHTERCNSIPIIKYVGDPQCKLHKGHDGPCDFGLLRVREIRKTIFKRIKERRAQ